MNRLVVVVLNFNGIDDTIACVESLHRQTHSHFDTVVIDNGSHDDSVDKLQKLERQYKKAFHVLYNTENLGFAGGVNCGIRWALERKYDGVLLLNNDAVASPTWIQELLARQAETNAGITTGLLLHRDGKTIDSTGDWYSKWGLPFPRNRNDKANKAPKAEFVFSATGGASLYSCEMLRQIGNFDETFFAYYEDVDISFRAQLAGWKVAYTPRAVAYHTQGATSNRMPSGFAIYQTFKNLPLLYAKNVPTVLLFPIGIRFYFAYLLMLGHAIKKGSGKAAVRGWWQSCILFWTHALPARRHIQSHRTVSAKYIESMLWPDLPPDQTGIRKLRRLFTGKN